MLAGSLSLRLRHKPHGETERTSDLVERFDGGVAAVELDFREYARRNTDNVFRVSSLAHTRNLAHAAHCSTESEFVIANGLHKRSFRGHYVVVRVVSHLFS
jgi:hypothetical protein